MNSIIFTILFVLCLAPLAIAASPALKKKKHKKAAVVINIACCIILLAVTFAMSVFAAEPSATDADAESAETETTAGGVSTGAGIGMLGAALVTGVACIGGGIAVSSAASAAIGAISENPNAFGKAIIFVAMAEGVPLYGMLVSTMILAKI